MVKRPRNVVGPQVQALRKKSGLKQEALAAKCQLLGWSLSRGTLAKIECQTRWVADGELFCLAKVLKVPVESFLPGQSQWHAALQTFLKHRNETQLKRRRRQTRRRVNGPVQARI